MHRKKWPYVALALLTLVTVLVVGYAIVMPSQGLSVNVGEINLQPRR